MSRLVTIAATQMACERDKSSNVDRAETLIREAAGRDAQIILIQELFETPYFCIEQDHRQCWPIVSQNAGLCPFQR